MIKIEIESFKNTPFGFKCRCGKTFLFLSRAIAHVEDTNYECEENPSGDENE